MFFNLKNFANSILKNEFWMSVGVISTGNALAQFLGVISTPILTRLYSPVNFGEYALLTSIASILIGVISLGLPSAIMVTKTANESKILFSTITFYTVLFSTLLLLFALIFHSYFTFLISSQDFYDRIFYIYFLVLINSIKSNLLILANKFKMNNAIFITALIGSGSTIFFSIPFGLLGLTQYGLLISSLLSGLLSVIYVYFYFKPIFISFNFNDFINLLIRFKNFVFFQFPSNIIEILSNQLPSQFLSGFFGSNTLGYFHMNEKLLGIPSRFIGVPINTIYFRTATEYFNSGKDLAKFTYSIVSKIMYISFLPTLIIILFGKFLFGFVLGEAWLIAGEISKFLIVLYVYNFVIIL